MLSSGGNQTLGTQRTDSEPQNCAILTGLIRLIFTTRVELDRFESPDSLWSDFVIQGAGWDGGRLDGQTLFG